MVGDAEESVVVDLPDVTGLEPSVVIDCLSGLLREIVVSTHDVRAPCQDLSVLRDLELDPGNRLPDRSELDPLGALTVRTGEVSDRP